MRFISSLGLLIGRILIAAIFLYSGVAKILFYDHFAQYMASKNLPMIPILLVLAAVFEIIGGLCLIFGFKTRFAASLLILYLIPVTYIFHDFWNTSDPTSRELQLWMFLKNLAIMGGLIYVDCIGSGGCSCDRFCRSRAPTINHDQHI